MVKGYDMAIKTATLPVENYPALKPIKIIYPLDIMIPMAYI